LLVTKYFGDQIEEKEMGGAYGACEEEDRNAYRISGGKLKE